MPSYYNQLNPEWRDDKPKRRASPLLVMLLLSLMMNIYLLSSSYIPMAVKTAEFESSLANAVFSPAANARIPTTVKFSRGHGNDLEIYERPPTAEVDAAWDELTQYASSIITLSSMEKFANQSQALKSVPGHYLSGLDVFHQLHCLDKVRRALDIERYEGPDFVPPPGWANHIRHCIGHIRQSLMCNADITPMVFQWSEGYQAWENREDIVHSCYDWSKIVSWAKENYYEATDEDVEAP